MQWPTYRYFDIYSNKFSVAECSQIIALQEQTDAVLSELHDGAGHKLRDSHLFWLRPSEQSNWMFERALAIAHEYNETYQFELCDELSAAQLTRYTEGQQYGWHMDLGSSQASLRKITIVVELTDIASHIGGGIEIFYGDDVNPKVKLNAGDALVFPSFVMHRASQVQSGVRWSLVLWVNGRHPFR
jgi:PKHD-type hydroxylase